MAIFSLIGTAVAGVLFTAGTTAFAIASSVIGGALAFGTSLLVSYLTRRKDQKRAYSAVNGEISFGASVAVDTIYGTGAPALHRIFYAKWGEGNKYNAEVFVLANGWCDGLEPLVYFYDDEHALVERSIIGNEAAHYGVDGFDELISIRFYDGRPGQGVDTKLVSDTAGLGRKWKDTSVATGLTYVVVERQWTAENFDKGRPDFLFVLRGLREYDPRKDSTVAGGSGSHRLDDPATWEHTHNPALHRLNYQLGLKGLISGRTLIGEGKSLGQLDLSSYFASMNACDELRADAKKIYECSLHVNADDDHTEVLREFDDAMCGYGLNRRGLSGVIAGAPQIPVADITADDIPLDRPRQIRPRKRAFDLFNTMSGQFTSPESRWRPESLQTVRVNADVAADGRVRQIAYDFLQVTDPDQAQYCLNVRYRQNRKGGSAEVPVSRRLGFQIEEGKWVTAYDKTWLVTGWSLEPNWRIKLKLAETGADVYDEAGIDPGPIVIPPLAPVNPSLLTTVQGFGVEAGLVSGAKGADVPALHFTWTPPNDPTITAVRFFYQIDGDPRIFTDQSSDPEAGEHTTTKDVVSGRIYVARATITTVPDRLKTYTPYVTTADPTSYVQVVLEELHEFVRKELQRNQIGMTSEVARLKTRVTDIASNLMENLRGRGLIEQSASRLKTKVVAETTQRISADEEIIETVSGVQAAVDENSAAIITESTARATADEAIADNVTVVQAKVDTNTAAIITESTARATADEAIADNVTVVQANVDTNTAAIITESTARATADEAIADTVTGVQANVDTNAASIITEASARATADSALATDITAVQATTNYGTASGLMGWSAVSGPAGVSARFQLAGRISVGSSVTFAGFWLDLLSGGGSRLLIAVDEFIVSDAGALYKPFLVSGGVLYADQIYVQRANIINFTATWAEIQTAVVDNFVANTANLGVLTVGTINLKYNAVADKSSASASGVSVGLSWTTVRSLTISNPTGDWPSIYAVMSGTFNVGASGGSISMRLVNTGTGNVMAVASGSAAPGGSGSVTPYAATVIDSTAGTTATYEIQGIAIGDITLSSLGGLMTTTWKKR